MEQKNKEANKVNKIKIAIGILLLIFIIYIFINYRSEIKHLNYRKLKDFILSYGEFSAVCFIIVYSLKPILLVVPTSLLTVVAGNIYGPFTGLALSMFSSFLAGTLAFYIAKFLGKPAVDKIIKGKALKLDESIEKKGFIIMLLMRLSIVFPYDGLSYGSGLTKMRYRDFILGTLLGILPEMIVYSFMGKNLKHPFSVKFILPIIVVVAIAFISYYVYKKLNKES